MAKLIEIDGFKLWVSERDGGMLRGQGAVTPNMPLPSNFPEQLTKEQIDQLRRRPFSESPALQQAIREIVAEHED